MSLFQRIHLRLRATLAAITGVIRCVGIPSTPIKARSTFPVPHFNYNDKNTTDMVQLLKLATLVALLLVNLGQSELMTNDLHAAHAPSLLQIPMVSRRAVPMPAHRMMMVS
jgi:phosphoribosylpyrophosphate synthetase